MWGYRDAEGHIVATSQNDMSGNSGWEEVPDGTEPETTETEQGGTSRSDAQRMADLEAQNADIMDGLIEVAGLVAGGE
ncbi:MAG: hypothetical protein EOM14_11090 [Clostridia bacterium]|nr:hypothetical protein [Clostridia bacterium]